MRKEDEGTGKNIGKKLLWTALLLNSLTYFSMRTLWYATGKVAAELKVVRKADDDNAMTYLVAGNINQPIRAFEWLMDRIKGGITFVNYAEKRGCSMKQIARQVIDDAKSHGYAKVCIIGISIGDYVGRWAESELDNATTVAINPEPSSEFLRPYAKWGLRVLTPLMELATIPMGWLSHVICVRKEFSFAFLADQWRDIAYLTDAPHVTDSTRCVISSGRMDEFLRHDVIDDYFEGVPMSIIDVRHGTTEANPSIYAQAYDELLRRIE